MHCLFRIRLFSDYFLRALKRGDNSIAPSVKLRVFVLTLLVRKHIFNRPSDTFLRPDGGDKSRDSFLELAVVKHNGVRLVTDKSAGEVVVADIRKKR